MVHEDEVFYFCNHTGLKCDKKVFIKLRSENYNLLLSKRQAINQPVDHCIAGGFWPEKIYKDHKPHCSFNENGYLLKDAYSGKYQGSTDAYMNL